MGSTLRVGMALHVGLTRPASLALALTAASARAPELVAACCLNPSTHRGYHPTLALIMAAILALALIVATSLTLTLIVAGALTLALLKPDDRCSMIGAAWHVMHSSHTAGYKQG